MSSTTIVVVVAVALLGLSSSSAAGLALANTNLAAAAPTLAPGASPPAGDAGADAGASPGGSQSNPFAPTGNTPASPGGSQSNPFAPTGTAPERADTAKPSAMANPRRGHSIAPRTAKPRKPSPMKTAPDRPSTTRAQCRDAIYNWVSGEVYPSVDFNVGYSTDTKWYDAYGSAGVRAACGGCVKKDEYGLSIGKALGVKRYNDDWDDTRRSKMREDSTRQWLATYMTEKMPDTC